MAKKKNVDYISPTQIGQWFYCPLSYKYCYVDGIKPNSGNSYLSYGEALHAALALNFQQKIASKKDLQTAEVIAEFKKSFRNSLAKLTQAQMYEYYANPKEMELIGEVVLESYMKKKAPLIQPTHVEFKFEIRLKKYPIKMMGVIDLIDENGFIIDHKTVGASKMKEWTQKTVDNNMQLTWYAAAYRKLFGKKEAGVAIDVIPRKSGADAFRIVSTRSQDSVVQMLEIASMIEVFVEIGQFMPNLASCDSCPFNNICPKKPVYVP